MTRLPRAIVLYRDGVWAGEGYLNAFNEVICSAVLGPDQEASDAAYEAITDAIENGDRSVNRPDGLYSWEIGSNCSVGPDA
jgi:hypothetical protein